jgi:hypothetical protein
LNGAPSYNQVVGPGIQLDSELARGMAGAAPRAVLSDRLVNKLVLTLVAGAYRRAMDVLYFGQHALPSRLRGHRRNPLALLTTRTVRMWELLPQYLRCHLYFQSWAL